MNRDSIVDYCACILLRFLGPVIRCLPLGFSLFLGRRLGDLLYYFDLKHKVIAYTNIKTALGSKLWPSKLSYLTKQFYRSLGQNLIEIFFIPLIDKEYLNKYITIEGLDYINEGFRKSKGVILLGVHAGGWELSNIICANIGFPFALFVRQQRYPHLDRLLHSYRSQKGCRVIQRQNQTVAQLIQALKNNQAVGMTIDQGGKAGMRVKFFGKNASMPVGAIKLALKYDAAIIPAFYTRINGPYFKIILGPIFEIKRTANPKEDIHNNLQEIIHIFEKYIRNYPQEYLWNYKIWKYSDEKSILILSDGKTGHTRQARAVANIVCDYFKEKGIQTKTDTITVEFKGRFGSPALILSSCLSGKYHCQGCLWCLRTFLRDSTYKSLISQKPDIVISCGSSVASVNYVLSRENAAKSIVILKPSILSMRRFDLLIMPRHDSPPKRKDIAITEGAPNLIDEGYLKEQSEKLTCNLQLATCNFYLGLLIGGDTKIFSLSKETVLEVIKQVKLAAEKLNANILVTTSRRTSRELEKLIKEEFKNYSRCKLLVIANEKNIPEAIGGILGLSKIVVVSGESISMISEAASSGCYVVVFASEIDSRHRRFLNYLARNNYIYLCAPSHLSKKLERLYRKLPQIKILKDALVIKEALKRII